MKFDSIRVILGAFPQIRKKKNLREKIVDCERKH